MGKLIKRLGASLRRTLFRLRENDEEKKVVSLQKSILVDLYKRRVVENALNVGDKLPISVLQNCFGETLNLMELLEKGPLVLKFHRGTWCSYCKADLSYYQRFHNALIQEGATAIAISTELPEKAMEMSRRSGFSFHMVADPTTEVAQQFGLLFSISEQVADAVMEHLGVDLTRFYGTTEVEVALPATYVIDRDGVILYAFIDEDFRNRANIEEVLYFVKKANINKRRYRERCEERSCVIRDFVKGFSKKINENRRPSKGSVSPLHRRKSKASSSAESASITSSEFERDPLRYCLLNEAFLESFKSYLDKTYCTENLLFFLETQQFTEIEEVEREENAKRIYDLFIRRGSDLEINVDDTTRERITNSLKKGDVNQDLFTPATKEVYHLMESDSFLKWRKTKEFHQIWESNGALEFLSPVPQIVAAAA